MKDTIIIQQRELSLIQKSYVRKEINKIFKNI